MSRMSWKTRLATTAVLCCLAMTAQSLRANDAPTESVGHASVYTAPVPEADPGAGLFEPVTQLAGDSCAPCAGNQCGPYPQAFHPPVYYPGLTDYAPTCFGARDWFKETFSCLQHRANQRRLIHEYNERIETAQWPTCCPPWACWGHYCDECPNVGCKNRCCLYELLDSEECHSGCGSHGTGNCSSTHCIPGESGASIESDNVITLASYEPSVLEADYTEIAEPNFITLVGHEMAIDEEEGVYRLGPAPGVMPTNCTVATSTAAPCVPGHDTVCNSTGCTSEGCTTPGCNGGCRGGANHACHGGSNSSSTCWSFGGDGPKTGWSMPFCNSGDGSFSGLFCKRDHGTYVDEYGVEHQCRCTCFGYLHDLIPSCELLPRHACSWGFHCLERAECKCKHVGQEKCPLHSPYLRFGKYNVAYEANPWHFDARDGRVYAAQGLGMPAAMPLAPNVQKTFNFGWGTPVSRLTPIWRNPQQYGP